MAVPSLWNNSVFSSPKVNHGGWGWGLGAVIRYGDGNLADRN